MGDTIDDQKTGQVLSGQRQTPPSRPVDNNMVPSPVSAFTPIVQHRHHNAEVSSQRSRKPRTPRSLSQMSEEIVDEQMDEEEEDAVEDEEDETLEDLVDNEEEEEEEDSGQHVISSSIDPKLLQQLESNGAGDQLKHLFAGSPDSQLISALAATLSNGPAHSPVSNGSHISSNSPPPTTGRRRRAQPQPTNSGSSTPVGVLDNSGGASGGRNKVFECKVCHHKFGYKHVLQNHERIHTGEFSPLFPQVQAMKCFPIFSPCTCLSALAHLLFTPLVVGHLSVCLTGRCGH